MATKEAYLRRNERIIRKSINRLMRDEEKIISKGYKDFMQAALDYLVEVHASTDHHVNEDSTLACGIIRDGKVVKIWGHDGGEQVKWQKATVRLMNIVPTLPQEGWVGVLLSGMKGWYNVDKEQGHLQETATWSKSNFTKFFKPIK